MSTCLTEAFAMEVLLSSTAVTGVEALRRLGLRGARFRLLVGDSSQVELIGLAHNLFMSERLGQVARGREFPPRPDEEQAASFRSLAGQ
jgi:hypothetical protein